MPVLADISHHAVTKAYACQCGYQENGPTYPISYVPTGSGCCPGNASNGLGFIGRMGNDEPQQGYIDGE
ncbi:hypothetical protein [Fibrella forsythiae]|uniref:Uncharacterized protein n=1 Tax=Fibrella forsythiae TaxID=2817061 RepID=A0ABS3JPP3_9BACT|nr:hypothetical protein [Fibrella forsythiae]MBO0951968.1 hypothetical protein [Fibrella forsythiae]